ncbi:shugoshin family protein [Abortiporus biennis]
MSRRQSRVSIDVRQNDTLLEFENFKKKFLLANKHITKLNSTLSVRIEELNAEISTLHAENLRLRASEIALTAQLKKEREKSRKVVADAEAATHNFMKHLGYIRKSHNIPHSHHTTPETQPLPPRARRPIIDPNVTPPMNRIARPPTIPGIYEDEEPSPSSPESPGADEEDEDDLRTLTPSPPTRRKAKPRSSSIPLPTRASSPPPPPNPHLPTIDFDGHLEQTGKRKPTRRQSGLLTTSMSITTITEVKPRASSPTSDPPFRPHAELEEEEEEVLAVIGGVDGEEPELIAQSITRREKRRTKVSDVKETEIGSTRREKERKRSRESEELRPNILEGTKKSRLKDVTNSPPSHSPLPPVDTNPPQDPNRAQAPDEDIPTSAVTTTSTSSARTFLTTPKTSPEPQLPTPRSSSPVPQTVPESQTQTGRERRVRKSVNYAEPKLNTKMRKPDAAPGTSKRSSIATSTPASRSLLEAPPLAIATSTSTSTDDALPPPVAGIKRKKAKSYVTLPEDDESDGAQADAEYGGLRGGWVNMEGRRRSINPNGRRVIDEDIRRHSMAV